MLRRFLPLDKNKIDTLYLELTNRCNANCIFCSHHLMKRPEQDMPLELARRILHEARPREVVLHFFGEPLLHPDIVDVVQHATNLGIKTTLDTNGHFLDPLTMLALLEAKLDRLVISAFPDPETYEDVWKGCSFLNIVTTIPVAYALAKTYPGHKAKVILRAIETVENRDNVDELAGFEHWCDKLELVPEHHLYGYDRPSAVTRKTPNCKQQQKLYKECVVKSNGDVTLCCYDLDGENVIGNVHETPIMDIWTSHQFETTRDVVYNMGGWDICRECPIFHGKVD